VPNILKYVEPQFPAALRVCSDLYRDNFTFLYIGVGGTGVSGKIDVFIFSMVQESGDSELFRYVCACVQIVTAIILEARSNQ
jgi:hypothetical protein